MKPSYLRLRKAFTITEMVVIVIILGILAAVALPQYKYAVERLKVSEGIGMLSTVLGAQKRYKFERGEYTPVLKELDVDISESKNFLMPQLLPSNKKALALVKRNGRGEFTYSLLIREDGSIFCEGGADDICTKIKSWP